MWGRGVFFEWWDLPPKGGIVIFYWLPFQNVIGNYYNVRLYRRLNLCLNLYARPFARIAHRLYVTVSHTRSG